MRDIDLSIIVPCYNEGMNISLLLDRFREVVTEQNVELVLVDNGSVDGSFTNIKELINNDPRILLIRIEKNIGYGHGIISGLKESHGNVLAWTHADLQTDLKDVMTAYSEYCKHNNTKVFVKGRRKNRKPTDALLTYGMSVISSVVLKQCLSDINAQPKLFSRGFYNKFMENAPHDFSLDLYALYFANRYGTIKEVPVYFNNRLHGKAKGGGSLRTKIKLMKRTFVYIFQMVEKINEH